MSVARLPLAPDAAGWLAAFRSARKVLWAVTGEWSVEIVGPLFFPLSRHLAPFEARASANER